MSSSRSALKAHLTPQAMEADENQCPDFHYGHQSGAGQQANGF
jgi:hypothetical protein